MCPDWDLSVPDLPLQYSSLSLSDCNGNPESRPTVAAHTVERARRGLFTDGFLLAAVTVDESLSDVGIFRSALNHRDAA